jgi:ElaB/YqjD/DUF883 family membrane-anchored ribosome-binding protein
MSKTNGKTTNRTPNRTAESDAAAEEQASNRAGEVVRESGAFLRDNAVPLGLVAVGAGMLAVRTVNGGDNRVAHAVDRARTKASETAASVKDDTVERAQTVGAKVREGGSVARHRVGDGIAQSGDLVRTHPVASGMVAAALGAGIAAAVRHRRG